MKLDRKTGVIIFSIIEFLERFSNFGFRSLVTIYIIQSYLYEDQNRLLTLFILLGLMPLPMGIITDLFLKRKSAILIGGFIAILGILLFTYDQLLFFDTGMLLFIVGQGLIRPNLLVLYGQLFKRSERKRNQAFILHYIALSIAALLSPLLIHTQSDFPDFNLLLIIIASTLFLAMTIFYVYKDKLPYTLIDEDAGPIIQTEDVVLDDRFVDEIAIKDKNESSGDLSLIIILIICVTMFWGIYKIAMRIYENEIRGLGNIEDIGKQMFGGLFVEVIYSLTIPICFMVYYYWSKKRIGSSLNMIIAAFLFLGLGVYLVGFLIGTRGSTLMVLSGIAFLFFSIGETIIAPIALAYITRLTSEKYASSIVGLFITSIAIVSIYADQLSGLGAFVFACIAILISGILLLSRKLLRKLSNSIE